MDEASRSLAFTIVTMANACSCDDTVMHHARQELTSEDKRYAAAHLNETDETRESAVAEIRRWIEESEDLRVRIGKNDHGPTWDTLKCHLVKFNYVFINFGAIKQNYFNQSM